MSPASHLDDLKKQRAALGERLASLHEMRDRLRDAESAESEALAAIGDLGRREVAAAKEWARSGSAGSALAIDHAERTELTQRLGLAQAQAEAARGAGAGVDAEFADVTHQAAEVARQIDHAAVQALAEQFETEWSAMMAAADTMRATVARVYAAVMLLRERADEHQAAGRHDEARRIFGVVERMTAQAGEPDIRPSIAETTAALPRWADRYAEITR